MNSSFAQDQASVLRTKDNISFYRQQATRLAAEGDALGAKLNYDMADALAAGLPDMMRHGGERVQSRINSDVNVMRLDLHGLLCDQALAAVEHEWPLLAPLKGSRMRVVFHIVVGQGRHSPGGVAQVKPAIESLLRAKGIAFAEAPGNPGMLVVPLSSHGQPCAEPSQPLKEPQQSLKDKKQPGKEPKQPHNESKQPQKEHKQPSKDTKQPHNESKQPRRQPKQPPKEQRQPNSESKQARAEAEQPAKELEEAERLKAEGNRLHAAGLYIEAVQQYQRARAALPEAGPSELHRICALNLAACYLKLERWRACIAECDGVLDEQPANAKALYRRGQALQARGNHSAAVQDLLQARALLAEQWNDSMEEKLRAALAAQVALDAEWAALLGRFPLINSPRKLAVLDEFLARYPEHHAALRERGILRWRLHDHQGTVTDLDRAEAAGSYLHPEILKIRAMARTQLGVL